MFNERLMYKYIRTLENKKQKKKEKVLKRDTWPLPIPFLKDFYFAAKKSSARFIKFDVS